MARQPTTAALYAAFIIGLIGPGLMGPKMNCQTLPPSYPLRAFPLLASVQAPASQPPVVAPGQLAEAPKLSIVVVDGTDAVNNIRTHEGTVPVVRVEDQDHHAVAGALVTFFVPNEGPGGAFAGGSQLLTVMTDQGGRAAATSFQPNSVEGTFTIQVTASYSDQTAAASISQSNRMLASSKRAASSGARGMSAGKIGLIAGIAAAGALGAVLGLSHGGGGSNNTGSNSTTTGTIGSPGTPVVGAPH